MFFASIFPWGSKWHVNKTFHDVVSCHCSVGSHIVAMCSTKSLWLVPIKSFPKGVLGTKVAAAHF
jgi:hypothetical protein